MSNEGPNVHELMAQLNGNHVFIRGNHDKNNGLNTPLRYAVIDTYGTRILLIHDPSDAGPILEGYRSIKMAFVAHKHLAWRFDDNMVNVGVDQWDYYPVDAKQILKAYKRWKEE
jgi:calcineurin-like phosphoesterase family protein